MPKGILQNADAERVMVKLYYWGTPDLSFWAMLGGGADKPEHRPTHTWERTAPASRRSRTGMHCAAHAHLHCSKLGTGRPLLSLAFKASCQTKLKDYAGITFPSVKRKDVSRMFNGLLKKEWPFFPLSGYALAFSESTPCNWVTTVSWQVTEPEWASNKTASRIYKY